jgi:hypothetical protein
LYHFDPIFAHFWPFLPPPRYHILIKDVARAHVYNVSITVHLDKQKELLSKGSRWHGKIDVGVPFASLTGGI